MSEISRIEALERGQQQLQEEVRQLKERVTEPITIPRIELDPGGIQNRLDNHAAMMQELDRKADLHTQAIIGLEQRMTSGFLAMEQRFETMEKRMDALAEDTQKRFDAIAEVQKLILERLPER